MSQAEESRLDVQGGIHHQGGQPFHFPSMSQDDRIHRIFGLSDEDSLPSVDDQALAAYYDYLSTALSLPFEALYCPSSGDVRQLVHYVRITELMDPRHDRIHNNLYGLFCRAKNSKEILELSLADLGVRDDNPNCQLLDDYAYWFVNWR